MKFLCGCNVEAKEQRYKTVRKDEAGRRICPEHGAQLENFMSPQVQGPAGNRVPDWKAMSPGGSFVPVMDPDSVAHQVMLRDLPRQADEILAQLRAKDNGK